MKPFGSPRFRIIELKGTQTTGAGGTTSVNVAVPFGRKWKLKDCWLSINESGKAMYINIDENSATQQILSYDDAGSDGVPLIHPLGFIQAASTANPYYNTSNDDVWIVYGQRLQFQVDAASASKTLTYRYCIEEYADDGHTASPT